MESKLDGYELFKENKQEFSDATMLTFNFALYFLRLNGDMPEKL